MIIIGARGQAKEVFDMLPDEFLSGDLFFYDDINTYDHPYLFNIRIVRSLEEAKDLFLKDNRFILGIGGPANRKNLFEKFTWIGGKAVSVIAASVKTGRDHRNIGTGTTIMHSALISPDVRIGVGVLINFGAAVHHDSRIGNFTEIAPQAVITGNVKIGDLSFIGANATILPNITVGSNAIVGAGSVVTKDIPDHTVVMGNPAIPYKK
jgi:sugar O-acyltransferase (sialic acid O-acetyltransferase NeuD family)